MSLYKMRLKLKTYTLSLWQLCEIVPSCPFVKTNVKIKELETSKLKKKSMNLLS